MKQGFEFLDTESGFKFKLTGTSDVLPKDITVVIPDDVDGAVLATSKEVEDLRTKLTNGTITVRNTDTVGNKQASDFALADLSNVDLSGLNIGTGGNSEGYFNIGSYENNVTGAVPAVNNFIPFLSLESDLNTIDASQKIDNSTFLLKAGRTYKIEGGLISFTATSGTATTFFKLYNANTSEEIVLDKNTPLYSQTSAGTGLIRNFVPNFYYTPTVDVHLKLKVFSSTLVSCTNYQSVVVITEYMSKDLALKSVTINGKTFDSNNNIDLEGLSTLSGYSTQETLTENRWIDGKPIYRKVLTYDIGTTTPADDITILSGIADGELGWITDFKQLDTVNGIVSGTSSTNYLADTSEQRVYCSKNAATIYIKLSDGVASIAKCIYYITIEYTKTTDTAQSPIRLVGSGNGTAGLVSELPAMVGSEGKLLRVNQNGLLEWKKKYYLVKTNSSAVNYPYITTTNIVIDSKVTGDNECSANGVNGGFVAPENDVYTISGDYFNSVASHGNVSEIVISIFVNNLLQKKIFRAMSVGGSNKGFDFSVDLKLEANDVVTFQAWIWATSTTTNNALVVPANSLKFTLASK